MLRPNIAVLVLLPFLLHVTFAAAQPRLKPNGPEVGQPPPQNLPLEFMLLDSPMMQRSSFKAPSMMQSLAVTKDFYTLGHYGIARLFDSGRLETPGWGEYLSLGLFDLFTSILPLSNVWMHEEWHRAVMGWRDIDSYNGVYDFSTGSVVPVRKVADEDLIRLKALHPADQVRLSSAGMEGDIELVLAMEKDLFFKQALNRAQLLIILNQASIISYRNSCASESGDELTDEMNAKEIDPEDRDFTGLDCTAYVYDLFRPSEPYEARGPHPSGVGINRYRKISDLTDAEHKYLKRMANYGYINLLDPFLLGIRDFSYGAWKWNTNVRHHLTPFGHSTEHSLFLKRNKLQLLAAMQHNVNQKNYRPGFSLQTFDYAVPANFGFDAGLMIWQQPKDLLFAAKDWDWGGSFRFRLKMPEWWKFKSFVETEMKSEGWVAGNPALDKDLALRFGFEGLIGVK